MTAIALVLVADEHLLAVIPDGNMNTRIAKGWQDAVKQVLVDCFSQCSHCLVVFKGETSSYYSH
jgi:hypothetical protein